jgi:hypothetical protein
MPDHNSVSERQRMIVGISGATGIAYGLRLLEALRELGARPGNRISGLMPLGAERR